MSQVQAIRGMSDLLPSETATWQAMEKILRDLLNAYGYSEIRVPIVERTDLFRRSIGEVTDVVEKEMYTFEDRNGESLTLRPEATAGIVRAGMTNGLLHNQRQKLWCSGPMFRYEKPQKGRYRQFYQFDIEALGFEGPDIDAELIIITNRIWQALGIDAVELELNSLGTSESRLEHRRVLTEYFERHKGDLDADSLKRLHRNPLRILDSKNPDMKEVVSAAPVTTDYLDAESATHFSLLRQLLDQAGIEYRVNPRLVRGLDYYSKTVFEWTTDKLGAQGTGLKVEMNCGGGSFKSQMKRADRSGAAVALILGEEEVIARTIGIKALREDIGQISVSWTDLGAALTQYIDNMGMEENG